MPCFHFSILGEPPDTHDGMDLPDLAAARLEAVRLAGAVLAETPETFWQGGDWRLSVTNCDRRTLFSLALTCDPGDEGVMPNEACPTSAEP